MTQNWWDFLLGNSQPGRGGEFKQGVSFESFCSCKRPRTDPPGFHGTLSVCWQGKARNLEKFLHYRQNTRKWSAWPFTCGCLHLTLSLLCFMLLWSSVIGLGFLKWEIAIKIIIFTKVYMPISCAMLFPRLFFPPMIPSSFRG